MKSGKIGCLFIYSVILIIIGMGIYKYREEILSYISDKSSEVTKKISTKAVEVKDKVKDKL
ncbi:MAG TPA: hypothetical protein QF753_10380 [Victivallales bacterium]|nr:hypothetical protein [Victivallales bacterium]